MKHPSTRALYDYWNRQRGSHAAPERSDIDPTAIPRVLADTFLLGVNALDQPIVRLAGTRVCALFCRELKDQNFVALFRRGGRSAIQDLLGIVCNEAVATVAGLTGSLADGDSTELELLLLPLRHRGRTDMRMLGVIVPLETPYWLGLMPIESLALGTLRHIGPVLEVRRPRLVPSMPLGRRRHGLLVYDGGRN